MCFGSFFSPLSTSDQTKFSKSLTPHWLHVLYPSLLLPPTLTPSLRFLPCFKIWRYCQTLHLFLSQCIIGYFLASTHFQRICCHPRPWMSSHRTFMLLHIRSNSFLLQLPRVTPSVPSTLTPQKLASKMGHSLSSQMIIYEWRHVGGFPFCHVAPLYTLGLSILKQILCADLF